jgi:similar to stage IV sporulation protein
MVTGPGLEKFLNLASQRRIPLWNIKRLQGDVLIVSTRVGGFRQLHPLVRKTGCKIKIKRKAGFPFLGAQLRRRWALCLGALLCLVAACLLTGQVWFIQLVGCPQRLEKEVKTQLASAGLSIGANKGQLDPNQIAEKLLTQNEALAWAGVEFHGTLARVRVVPKLIAKEKEQGPCHLVATRDAELIHLIVYSGQGLAQAGEMVKKGQILVTGQVLYKPDEANPLVRDTGREFTEPTVKNVRASAFAEGRFWLEGYGEASGRQMQKQLKRTLLVREYYLGKVRIWKRSLAPKTGFARIEREESAKRYPLKLRIVESYGITELKRKRLTAEETARQQALSQVRQQLGAKDKIEKLKPIVLREGELVRVKILAECRGPVAVEKPFTPGQWEGEHRIEHEPDPTNRTESGAKSLRPPR